MAIGLGRSRLELVNFLIKPLSMLPILSLLAFSLNLIMSKSSGVGPFAFSVKLVPA